MNNNAQSHSELEVQFKPDSGKAVIEGKTVIPFQAFVTLILQRKVLGLFKQWGKEPIIVGSELLTGLASAGQDNKENRANLILVSIGVGAVVGIAIFAIIQLILLFWKITLGVRELTIIGGGIIVLGLLLALLTKLQKIPRGEKITDAIEDLSSFLSK